MFHPHVPAHTHHVQYKAKNIYQDPHPMHTENALDTMIFDDTNSEQYFFVSMIGDVCLGHVKDNHLEEFCVFPLQ